MRGAALLSTLALIAGASAAKVTSPERQFGHPIGADYELPNYTQLVAYWQKLDRESDRMRLVTIGKTEEGRYQMMAIVSSPKNLRRAEHYRDVARRLAEGKGVDEAEAHRLAKEGKAIVWIDGGLHASEVLGAQQLMETLYQMLSRDDAETRRILDDCIILFVHANPDGMDLLSNWYMREKDPKKRSTTGVPRLYQKYIGHDDNRDFYMSSQRETQNMNRVMYREWYPQIMYNHHQTGPSGAVLYAPPFRDPYNHNVDPLTMVGTDIVGNAIHERLMVEGKPGAVRSGGASYSTWFNGSLRTTSYFHNMVGILTETIGNPTPIRIPLVPERQLMSGNLLAPVAPQEWHFRQSVDYSVSCNYAVLDIASRRKDEFLFNRWRMATNSIRRGSEDHWTVRPKWIESGADALAARLKDSAARDARAYVLPSDQKDFPTAVSFANTLILNGVMVERASSAFVVAGKNYPIGSLVVRCDQANRPHILDMFEPQDHPNDIPAPGANPTAPYDLAGYTLAFQMGVSFDRILDRFDAPTEAVKDMMSPPPGRSDGKNMAYVISKDQLNGYTLVQRLLSAGTRVAPLGPGSYYVSRFLDFDGKQLDSKVDEVVDKAIVELGIRVRMMDQVLHRSMTQPRIGLWDRYGGSIESGWIRYIFDQRGIPYVNVYAPEFDAGNLKAKYDVLIFPDGASFGPRREGVRQAEVPEEYRAQQGSVSEATVPALKRFMEEGGSVVAIGTATTLAKALSLPVEDAIVDAEGKRLPRSKYYVPGSLLTARVDATQPIAWGMPERADFAFDNSPVFRFRPEAEAAGLKKVAWFDTDAPLHSGWAWGQSALKDGIVAFTAPVGKGTLFAFGPEITFRAQSWGTFRLLFNAIYR